MVDGLSADRTLLELFLERARRDTDREATRHLHQGLIVSTTWGDWSRRSRTLATALIRLGVRRGDRVALLSGTRVEWAWMDIAIMMAGGISVPIFPTEVPGTCAQLLTDCTPRFAVVEDPSQAAKLFAIRDQLPELERLVLLEREVCQVDGGVLALADITSDSNAEWVIGFDEFRELGESSLEDLRDELDARIARHEASDCVTLHYTPGTEGLAKGVMLTQRNFAATARAIAHVLPLGTDDVQILYLPLAQPFARICLAVGMEACFVTAFARSYRTVIEDCASLQPTFVCGVPRLFERVRTRLELEQRKAPALERFAVSLGRKTAASRRASTEPGGVWGDLQDLFVERVVEAPVKEVFGGRLRFAISGGAPLTAATGQFYREHGLEILEGYGMTETTAATHLNHMMDNRLGTVGRPLPGMEAQIAADGEVLLRGAHVTPGYWNKPAETAERLGEDGWLRTGDLGSEDAQGYLTITGRKRDVIITANGKAIAPQPIIKAIRDEALVDQVLIHGDRRHFLTALFSLDKVGLQAFADEHGLEESYEALARHPEVYAVVEAAVERVNKLVASHEQIRKFAILGSELTPEDGEITQTRVLRRKVVAERHKALLDSFYLDSY
ncbi:MAG: AMP-dependent synthetase/ligase [Myxococcota bacterium]